MRRYEASGGIDRREADLPLKTATMMGIDRRRGKLSRKRQRTRM
uniref:Uncharacterized protein n=1 Tax=Rhizophora mucronata TaxID=61149 RepID=A0A2P2R1C7_RHIMU